MKQITLTRLVYESEQVLGYFFDGLDRLCCTLEPEWDDNMVKVSCITPGVYKVVSRYSAKYGHHFHVLDVKGRTLILIHFGNYNSDTIGCIIVGNNHTDINNDGCRDVTSSKVTMKKLINYLPKEFELRII